VGIGGRISKSDNEELGQDGSTRVYGGSIRVMDQLCITLFV